MRVLITGAAGFIGSAVTRALVDGGHEVIAADLGGVSLARLEGIVGLRHVEMVSGDARSVERLFADGVPECIVHSAWYAHPTDYLSSAQNLDSLDFTLRLAQKAFDSGCRKFVGIGTCLEYERTARPACESDPTDPRSLYAATKLGAFLSLRAMAALEGVELAWARVFHLYGPNEHPSRFVPQVLAALRSGTVIEVTAGEQVRDYLHLADVASGVAALVSEGAEGVFNVCSGQPRPLRDLVEILGRLTGRRDLIRTGARPYGPDEEMYLAGTANRLRSLGWAPRFASLEAGLEDITRSEA